MKSPEIAIRPSGSTPFLRYILGVEWAGFTSLISLLWLNELLDLPHLFFGDPSNPARIREAMVESGVVFVLAGFVMFFTRRLLGRVTQLESFIVMCAWCRRVRLQNEWLPFETYLQAHRATTSHGVCPDCKAQFDGE